MRADLVERADVLLSAAALLEGTGNAIDRREAAALRSYHADLATTLRALRDAPVAVQMGGEHGRYLSGDPGLMLSIPVGARIALVPLDTTAAPPA